jgi:hypothetical protein
MILTCKVGSQTKVITVNTYDILHVLFEKLGLTDEDSKFTFKGKTYDIASTRTFAKIGLVTDTKIFIINQAISGN